MNLVEFLNMGGYAAFVWPSYVVALAVLLTLSPAGAAYGEAIQYERPVDRAPQEKDIGGGYVTPKVQKPLPRGAWLEILDLALLGAAMGASIWIVLKRRDRRWFVALTAASVAYFGFYREGCVCPIGSIQNVTVSLTDPRYHIPIVVTATFFLPLVVGGVIFGAGFAFGAARLTGDKTYLRGLQSFMR